MKKSLASLLASQKANLKIRTTFMGCQRLIRVHLWLISLILCELCASVAERLPNFFIGINELKSILKDKTSVFSVSPQGISKVCFFKDHFYKLVPTEGYPTIEINGIRMHQTKNMTPDQDTKLKIELLHIFKNATILDICTGPGYTAIEAYKKGAEVTTIEKDICVLEIDKINPYSKELFEGGIKIIIADAFNEVKRFSVSYFDFIVHDPPRFALSPG
ncbi:MAG: hypothetical protein AB1422_03230 [bacterium]